MHTIVKRSTYVLAALGLLSNLLFTQVKNNEEEKARDVKRENPRAVIHTYEELYKNEKKSDRNVAYEVSRAKYYRDSVRILEFRRQGIDTAKEARLRTLVPDLYADTMLGSIDPRFLTVYAEVIVRGIVIGKPSIGHFTVKSDAGTPHKWGSYYVDIYVSEVLKAQRVTRDEPVKVRKGDVLRIYDVENAYIRPPNKPRTNADLPLQNKDEAYFFADRNIWFYKDHRINEFHASCVYPIIGGMISCPTPNVGWDKMVEIQFKAQIDSITTIIKGKDRY